MAGLSPIVANRFKSGLLDIPSYRSISIMNSELTCTDGAGTTADGVYRRCRTYPAIYGDFVEVVRKAQAETLPPHRSIQSICSPATVCHTGGFTTSRSWVERYSHNCVD